MELDIVIEVIAVDCQWLRPSTKSRKYEAKCGIRFTDLGRVDAKGAGPAAKRDAAKGGGRTGRKEE